MGINIVNSYTIHYVRYSSSPEFSACKTAQDDSVSLVDSCKEQAKCGGAASKEEAEKLLKALTP